MRLPYADQASVPIEKLTDYCLNPDHPRGRHKARVFASALGITADHAESLRQMLLAAAATLEAVPGEKDEYGRRFVIDLEVQGISARGKVRSLWIIKHGEDVPRLTSCYVL